MLSPSDHISGIVWTNLCSQPTKILNYLYFKKLIHRFLLGGRGGGLVDRAADSGPCDLSSIPLGEKKENKQKEAGVGPYLKKSTGT